MQPEILDFIIDKPEAIWLLSLIGAVCVIGVVDFCKNWVKRKAAIKWVVFFVSLFVAVILSPLTPPLARTIIILWLLILALATITRNAIVDGLPALITHIMGSTKTEEK